MLSEEMNMLIKNQIYETTVTDYTSEGQGVAHVEGCAVFIPNAIAGEKVKVRIEKAQKTWAAGKIVEILEKSLHRINRECPVAKLCGGCDFWHMDYEEETRLKAERVRQCLNRMGGEQLEQVENIISDILEGEARHHRKAKGRRRMRFISAISCRGKYSLEESVKELCKLGPILPQPDCEGGREKGAGHKSGV